MGSGCDKKKASGRCVEVTPDNCVIYTGPDIPSLGICNGDKLSEIEAVIFSTLEDLKNSKADLEYISLDCEYTQHLMQNKEKDLFNLLQALYDSQCELKSLIDGLSTKVNQPMSFDTKCLTLPSEDLKGIIQALINNSCKNSTDIEALQDQITGDVNTTIDNRAGNLILSAITVCDKNSYGITKSGSGANPSIKIYALVPPMCPIPCIAPTSNFDSTGKGLPDSPYCGMYVMNGMNGTPDWRGFGFASAINLGSISSTATLHPNVDPYQPYGGFNSTINLKYGTNAETLLIHQMPKHSHDVIDNGHVHTFPFQKRPTSGSASKVMQSTDEQPGDPTATPATMTISKSNSNIVIVEKGGGGAHNNVQPTVFGYWIIRLS